MVVKIYLIIKIICRLQFSCSDDTNNEGTRTRRTPDHEPGHEDEHHQETPTAQS